MKIGAAEKAAETIQSLVKLREMPFTNVAAWESAKES